MIIAICGAGTMGRGIALACIQAGFTTLLFDSFEGACEKAQVYINEQIRTAVAKGKLTKEQSEAASTLLTCSTTIECLQGADIIIEAIIEDIDAKLEFFKRAETEYATDKTILATNTSSIAINSIASKLMRPQQFVGLHFFNPAHIMKLVEIIRGVATSDDVVSTCTNFVRKLGKTPAVAKDVPGFIVNRVARNYYNEAQRIVMEGAASIEQVDTLMKSLGFKMGPFELMDLIGVDVNLSVTKSIYDQYFNEPRFQPSLMQQQYVDAGLFGRKTGKGFYIYDIDNKG